MVTAFATRRTVLVLGAVTCGNEARRCLFVDYYREARQLTIAGRVRPLDDLTLKLLLDWLEHRRRRWPNTANSTC